MDRLLLFGSHATGRAGPESDVDILLVSPTFDGLSAIKRGVLARRAWNLPYPVDFLCYTPQEHATLQGEVSIVRVAEDEGIAVA